MTFHKLVQSIEYVSYPSLVELREIRKKITGSFTTYLTIIISVLVTIILDSTNISKFIVQEYCLPSNNTFFAWIDSNINIEAFISVLLGVFCIILMFIIRFFFYLFHKNNDTPEERQHIIDSFYKQIIPQLITAKSIIERFEGTPICETQKRSLILIQAKGELSTLISNLDNLHMIELKNDKITLTECSNALFVNVIQDEYITVLNCLLDTIIQCLENVKTATGLDTSIPKSLINSVSCSTQLNISKEYECNVLNSNNLERKISKIEKEYY